MITGTTSGVNSVMSGMVFMIRRCAAKGSRGRYPQPSFRQPDRPHDSHTWAEVSARRLKAVIEVGEAVTNPQDDRNQLTKSEQIISHRQPCIGDPAFENPCNDWTKRHSAQGSTWREGSVSFSTLMDFSSRQLRMIAVPDTKFPSGTQEDSTGTRKGGVLKVCNHQNPPSPTLPN
ncbi:competence protein ComJ [Deinococcus sp.]|uniref:competence protein ComJ n=1 Tax=Deinococcus sp. TaxID=47478 RepID=UPI0038D3B86D